MLLFRIYNDCQRIIIFITQNKSQNKNNQTYNTSKDINNNSPNNGKNWKNNRNKNNKNDTKSHIIIKPVPIIITPKITKINKIEIQLLIFGWPNKQKTKVSIQSNFPIYKYGNRSFLIDDTLKNNEIFQKAHGFFKLKNGGYLFFFINLKKPYAF